MVFFPILESWSVLEAFRILKITGYAVELQGLSGLGEKIYSVYLFSDGNPKNVIWAGAAGKTGETCAFKILKVTS